MTHPTSPWPAPQHLELCMASLKVSHTPPVPDHSQRRRLAYLVNAILDVSRCGDTRARSNGRVACYECVRHALQMPTLGHARYTQDSQNAQALRAGELSRGVGLRGFESHPLAFRMNPVVCGRKSHSPHHPPSRTQADMVVPGRRRIKEEYRFREFSRSTSCSMLGI